MKFDKLVVLSIVLCAAVLAGELMAYGPNMRNYSADAEFGEESVTISVTSSGADRYSSVFFDNGTHPAPAQLYIYLDERYDKFLKEAKKNVGLKDLDLKYSIDQMCKLLKIRGFDSILTYSGEQLFAAMAEDMSGQTPKGLLVMSYALPESIYSGSEDCLLFEWIGHGNNLYWMSSPIGMFYHGGSGLITVENNQEVFFGRECVNMGNTNLALSVIEAGGLTDALALKWNRVLYGLDASGLYGAFSMGFSQDGYSSVSMVPFGDGMICVVGGEHDRYQRDDMAQVIASGLSCHSQILDARSGSVIRGTEKFLFEIPDDAEELSVYVSIGGYYVVYGRAFKC